MLCKMRSHENSFTERGNHTGNKEEGGERIELSIVVMYDLFVHCTKLRYLVVSSGFKSYIE